MLRVILAVVAGVVIAVAVTLACELLFQQLTAATPMPRNTRDRAAMQAYVEGLPLGAMLAVIAGWALAALAGGFTGARLARRGAWPGLIVLGVFLVVMAINFVMVPHPLWFMAAAVVVILAAGAAGARLGSGARVAPSMATSV